MSGPDIYSDTAGSIGDAAPEIPLGLAWLNTGRAYSISDLLGMQILLNFWSLFSVKCLQTAPAVDRLQAENPDDLVVLHVHSSTSEEGKGLELLRDIVALSSITQPVINDTNLELCGLYDVQTWPTLVLIGRDGALLSHKTGRSALELTKMAMQGNQAESPSDAPGSTLVLRASASQAMEEDRIDAVFNRRYTCVLCEAFTGTKDWSTGEGPTEEAK